ncbi:hypothetical protein Acsp03_20770 [Actinomadura sp. NBRC 104412]|uniref:hypothetical protein n=1 Tax=Actinomadura sp. NBRC 104412 TaxID=3032203 RepID=UPI0024A283AC|nr:hypothetical protein [Actinomadura sp. NBRC 104412]GLZ04611.1 hypothetical protein Acsp03_20770 [Actinomadura sp. NBRC 104412]
MRDNTNLGVGLRRTMPVVVLAAVTAMSSAATAAPEPPRQQGSGGQSPKTRPAQPWTTAVDDEAVAHVPCAHGAGDTALARAIRAGGRIALVPNCTYVVTKRHGENSALPPITRDTVIEGRDSVITWGGRDRVPALVELAGQNVRFVLRGVRLKRGRAMTTIRTRPGSSGSVENYGSNQAFGDEAASVLASWLSPGLEDDRRN